MPGDERYTAYCGLYCRDCIPVNERLFAAVDELDDLLADVQFEKYAALKAAKESAFRDYRTFVRVLGAMKGLKCKTLCTEGGCKDGCRIRACVMEKGLRGCWQCSMSGTCELHVPMKDFHPDLVHNLQMIKQYGPDDWSDKRGRHYNWSK